MYTIYVSSYYYICVFILLYMCSHTAIYVSSYYYICVLRGCSSLNSASAVYMCVLTVVYLTNICYYICVLILLYMCLHTTICVSHTAIYVSSYCYMCPHTTTCVLILLYMCLHSTIYASSYYYICVLILIYN